ncbi:MAG: glucokinase [Candidatus Atribacteria bacterium]|nr:glucokinase [Candidatus Atribacteria bacterium]
MTEKFALGIDIGGTKLRVGLVNEKLEMLDLMVTQKHRMLDPESLTNMITACISQLIDRHPETKLIGAGVGYPGPINFLKGSTFSYCNLLSGEWNNVPLQKMIERKVDLPTILDNDANLAGLAEMYLGAGQGLSNVVYLTISTGIGGAIFINKKIYRGFLGSAGEFGHMVIDIHGMECKCGNKGCFMSQVSGLGLEKIVREDSSCSFLFSSQDDNDDCVKKLLELAISGHPSALKAVQPLAHQISTGLLNIVYILNPEAIVVGGSLGKAFLKIFSSSLNQYLKSYLPEEVVSQTKILEAKLGDVNGILGGAILVFDSLEGG